MFWINVMKITLPWWVCLWLTCITECGFPEKKSGITYFALYNYGESLTLTTVGRNARQRLSKDVRELLTFTNFLFLNKSWSTY